MTYVYSGNNYSELFAFLVTKDALIVRPSS